MAKKMKKGFTLAELLIVVAIIAVLTAIAVPLFVTSLNKAQNAADDANVSSLRSVAVVYILNLEKGDEDYEKVFTFKDETNTEVTGIKANLVATANVDAKGNFTNIALKVDSSAKEGVTTVGGTKTVTAKITAVDLETAMFKSGS